MADTKEKMIAAGWLDDVTEFIPVDELLHNIAGACYDNLDTFDEDADVVSCDPTSFRVLEEAYLYLYEKYVVELERGEALH